MSESARVTMDGNGRVTVYTGSSPHGQGEETTFAQLASEELGVPFDRVAVVWGDTVLIPYGVGTFGSRSAATGGSAVVEASRKLKSQLFAKSVRGHRYRCQGARHPGREAREQVKTRRPAADPQGDSGKTRAEMSSPAKSVFRLSSMIDSSGVHVCAVTLDPELGTVKIAKYVVVEDCGRMINKTIVEGQLHGGVIHAVGGALFERLAYDDQGNLLTSTLMDYSIPTALDSPNVEVFHEVTPSTATLNGAKGVGESGTIAAYAAVMNAINDAMSLIRPGAQVNVAPSTPDSIFSALGVNHPESGHTSDNRYAGSD